MVLKIHIHIADPNMLYLGIIKSLNETIYNKNIFNYCLNFGSIKKQNGKKVRNANYKNLLIKILL